MRRTPADEDRDLLELFDEARDDEQRRLPSFRSVLQRPTRARPSTSRLRLVAAVAGVAAGAAVFVWALAAGGWLDRAEMETPLVSQDLETERSTIAQNRAPRTEPRTEQAPTPEPMVAAEPVRPRVTETSETLAAAADTAAPTSAQPTTKFTDEFIQDLPVPGGFYQNVLTLAPGAEDADGDGNPNVRGSRDRALVAGASGATSSRAQDAYARAILKQDAWKSKTVFVPVDGPPSESYNAEGYRPIEEKDFLDVAGNPLSTFSIDVDTASYANVRRFLSQGRMPPPDAVRVEEMINYFDYDYPQPDGERPFSVSVEVADCPWEPNHRLARIGLKGRAVSRAESNGSNLVFLLDVSGSMKTPSKLPLLKAAFTLLVEQLTSSDRVAIVVYAGASGLVLPSTSGDSKTEILAALDRLHAGGGTNGGEGLRMAYRVAREHFIPGGINRVILATDGDFNLGTTSQGELVGLIEKDAKRGVLLTALGFGYGNLQDDRLEHLADKGNGNYAYIDRLKEARKVLVEELSGTLITIAKDVKVQVEFNPLEVASYRLVGYENRMLRKEDFNDDRKDAGEIGAEHTVTALYELIPPGSGTDSPAADPLKYQTEPSVTREASAGELLTVKLRYKEPEGERSRLIELPVRDDGLSLGAASDDFRFAAAVAEFGLLLRGSAHRGQASFESVERLADGARGPDARGYRSELVEMVREAGRLAPRPGPDRD